MSTEDIAAIINQAEKIPNVDRTALDLQAASSHTTGESNERQPKQVNILIDLVQSANLFHTTDGTGYADIEIDGHPETWPIRSKGFRRWLLRQFYQEMQGAPNSEALQSALGVIEARAHYDAPLRNVHIRVGG